MSCHTLANQRRSANCACAARDFGVQILLAGKRLEAASLTHFALFLPRLEFNVKSAVVSVS